MNASLVFWTVVAGFAVTITALACWAAIDLIERAIRALCELES